MTIKAFILALLIPALVVWAVQERPGELNNVLSHVPDAPRVGPGR